MPSSVAALELLKTKGRAMTATATRPTISLSGSVATVTEFFGFAVNSILYQRAVYPADCFDKVTKYGLPMVVSTDAELNSYLSSVLAQVAQWVAMGRVHKLVLLVTNPSGELVHERWAFDVLADAALQRQANVGHKSDEAIRGEIQALFRQVTSAVTFLPMLPSQVAFDLLIYTSVDCPFPASAWEPSDPRLIAKSNEMRLRSFTTSFHKVDASVSFHA